MGANGSGKTTLLRLLSSYARPSSGQRRWKPQEGASPEDDAATRTQIGVVAHTPLVYDELTVAENLSFSLRMHGRPATSESIERWLDAFGLGARATERTGSLSQGLKQRSALARAFAVEPRLLLLDEPAAGLDAEGIERLRTQLRLLRGRVTIVVATHEPDLFRSLATRALELRDGRLWDQGGPA